ncbi:hypothetical protein BH10ACI2_BH10ACI2_18910 [soil metagenome]
MDRSSEKAQGSLYVDNLIGGETPTRVSSTIFLLLCFIPVFSTILFGGVDTVTWIMISVLWLAIVLLWIVEAWNSGGLLINTSSLQLPILGWVAIGIVQLMPLGGGSGDQGGIAVSRALSMDPYSTRFFLVRLVVYFVFFAACLTFINNEKRLKKVVTLAILFGSIMAFYGILQRLANPDGIYGLRATPQSIPFGPFVNQHHSAAFMQMTGGLALGLLFGKDMGREKMVLLASAFVLMGVAVILPSSRGGLLGFVTVVSLVVIFNFMSGRWSRSQQLNDGTNSPSQKKLVLAAAVGALLILVVGTVLFVGGDEALLRGTGIVNSTGDVTNGRGHFWPVAISIFRDHPILGAGFDAFGVAFTSHDSWNGLLRVEQAHNEYLQTLTDSGIAGFICIAGFIFLLFRKGLATISNAAGFSQEAAIGALAGCAGILVHSFFDFPLRTPSNAFFFLTLCAIATVSISGVRQRR